MKGRPGQVAAGTNLNFATSHDGIGASDFSAVSGQLWLNLPLN
jgi:hypothetical protein